MTAKDFASGTVAPLNIRFNKPATGRPRTVITQVSPVRSRSQAPGSGTDDVPPKFTVKVRSVILTEVVIGKSGGSAFGPVRLVMSNSPALPGKIRSQERTATGNRADVTASVASMTTRSPSRRCGKSESVTLNGVRMLPDPTGIPEVGLKLPVKVALTGIGFVPPIGIAVPL